MGRESLPRGQERNCLGLRLPRVSSWEPAPGIRWWIIQDLSSEGAVLTKLWMPLQQPVLVSKWLLHLFEMATIWCARGIRIRLYHETTHSKWSLVGLSWSLKGTVLTMISRIGHFDSSNSSIAHRWRLKLGLPEALGLGQFKYLPTMKSETWFFAETYWNGEPTWGVVCWSKKLLGFWGGRGFSRQPQFNFQLDVQGVQVSSDLVVKRHT